MHLNWIQCQGDVWCKLNSVNLDHAHFDNMHGVYMIWHSGLKPAVVYVGRGYIKDCIAKHRNDTKIQEYEDSGLYITWARVAENEQRGIVAYLSKEWLPKIKEEFLQEAPIEVNFPW